MSYRGEAPALAFRTEPGRAPGSGRAGPAPPGSPWKAGNGSLGSRAGWAGSAPAEGGDAAPDAARPDPAEGVPLRRGRARLARSPARRRSRPPLPAPGRPLLPPPFPAFPFPSLPSRSVTSRAVPAPELRASATSPGICACARGPRSALPRRVRPLRRTRRDRASPSGIMLPPPGRAQQAGTVPLRPGQGHSGRDNAAPTGTVPLRPG